MNALQLDNSIKPKVQRTLDIIEIEIDRVGIHSILLTFEELTELTGASLRTVKRHVEELEEKGYLFVDRYKCEITNQQMPNEYSLTPFNNDRKPVQTVTLKSLIDFEEENDFWNQF